MARHHKLCLVNKVQRSGEPEQLADGLSTVAETRAAELVTRQDGLLSVPRSRTEMGRRRFHCRWPVLYSAADFTAVGRCSRVPPMSLPLAGALQGGAA